MPNLSAFNLREQVLSNITTVVLVVVALMFVGSFDVVPLKTGELINPLKKDLRVRINGQSPLPVPRPEPLGWESAAG